MSRILLIGATGYTGRLVAHELADAGAPFVLAARNPRRLNRLAEEVGGRFETQVVDVRRPDTLWRLVRSGDAVINCAGPFTRLGDAVIRACTEAGAHYLDTTGEQAWMRSAEVRHDEAARTAGVAVVNGMAFEYALGDCAAAVAAAGMATPLRSLDVIYAWKGAASSRGTRRTALRMLGTRALVLEDRALRARPQAARRRQVRLSSNRTLTAVSFGSGEVVTVPRWADVETVRGWLVVGRRTARVAPMIAPALPYLVPVLRLALRPLATRAPDPSEAERRASRFTIRLELEDTSGATRALEVRGRDPYGLTAAIAVRGALRMLEPGARSGVLAPSQLVDAEPFLAGLRVLGVELVS